MENAQAIEFTRQWTRVQSNLFAYISSTVYRFADAQDVLQNTAVAALKKFEDYDPDRPFVAWALGIARFEILQYLRANSNDRHDLMDEEFLTQVAGGYQDCQREIDDRQHSLAECISKLQERARKIVEYRYADELKSGAIAELMGLSPGNVSVILNRSYQALRECIDNRLEAEANL